MKKFLGMNVANLLVDTLQTSDKTHDGKNTRRNDQCQPTGHCRRYYIAEGKKRTHRRDKPGLHLYACANGTRENRKSDRLPTSTPEQTIEELNILVDNGVTVKDVKIEHPVYGDLKCFYHGFQSE